MFTIPTLEFSTGILNLDKLLEGIKPGDNVVFQATEATLYRPFVQALVAWCRQEKRRLIYVRVDGSLDAVMKGLPEDDVFDVTSAVQGVGAKFQAYIQEQGKHVYYVVDNFTALRPLLGGEQELRAFFLEICPVLYKLETVAYWLLLKSKHPAETVTTIKDTTQIFLELAVQDGKTILKPIKILGRYPEHMFVPHRVTFRDGLPAISKERETSIATRLLFPIVVISLIATIGLSLYIYSQEVRLVRERAEVMAQALAVQISAERNVYTEQVVERLEAAGVKFTAAANYRDIEGGIPLPATFVHQVSERVSKRGGYRLNLLSPWAINPNKAPQTDFERQVLQALVDAPSQPQSAVLTEGDQSRLFYAVADVATSRACVSCHNAHPDSPRRDFGLGDVMGAIVVEVPLTNGFAAARDNVLRLITGLVTMFGGLAAFVSVVQYWRVVKPVRILQTHALRVARGDLETPVLSLGEGEIGLLVAAFENMREGLRAAVTEKSRLYAEAQQRLAELSVIFEVSTALRAAHNLAEMLPIILEKTADLLKADAGALLLRNRETGELEVAVGLGPLVATQGLRLKRGEGIAGHVVEMHEPHITHDLAADPRLAMPAAFVGLHGGMCLPLRSGEEIVGALLLGYHARRYPMHNEVRLVSAVAEMAGIAIHRVRLFEQTAQQAQELAALVNQLEESYDHTLAVLCAALDARDHETEGHSRRVAGLACAIAREMGLPKNELQVIYRGALLHDVGKIGISDTILHKPTSLSDQEWEITRQHPEIGSHILQGIRFLGEGLDIVAYHHERYDGTGYPGGLKGEEIPLSARIFAVADAYDAMTSDRPYRAAMSHEDALAEIVRHSGTQFDPKVVETFVSLLRQGFDITWGGTGVQDFRS